MRLGAGLLAIALTVSAAMPRTSLSAPGELDSTFGSGGFVATNVGHGLWGALVALVQPDGKIVAAGQGELWDIAVARYLPDGTLDAVFGTGGFADVATPYQGTRRTAWAVAAQADGKLLVLGDGEPSAPIVVIRLTGDGVPDPSFGAGGRVELGVPGLGAQAYALAVQPDGKIVVGGVAGDAAGSDFLVLRLDDGGALDPSFGTSGVVVTDLGSDYDAAYSVFVQPDGKIVAVGAGSWVAEGRGIGIVRYDDHGTLDPTFGLGGKLTDITRGEGHGGALQPDGRILVGSAFPVAANQHDLAVTRYDAIGAVDTTFGAGGTFRQGFGAGVANYYQRLTLQPDGKVLAVGSLDFNASGVVRLTTDGQLDAGFGADGVVPFAGRYVWSLALQSDQSIVGVGSVFDGQDTTDFALLRLQGVCAGPDTDGDGVVDACDPCTNGRSMDRPVIQVTRLAAPAGDEQLKVTGRATVTLPAPDPSVSGARFVLTDAAGAALVDVAFPILLRSGLVVPTAGIDRMKVRISPKGRVTVAIRGKNGTYPVSPASLPLKATVVLAPPRASGDDCLETTFSAAQCLSSGTKVRCK